MKRDVQATEEANFFESTSYVAKDGRHVLFGIDWKERKGELNQRSGGRCENMVEDVRCGGLAMHPHHIIHRRTKGSNTRDDRMDNLLALCDSCHRKMHPDKQPKWGKS